MNTLGEFVAKATEKKTPKFDFQKSGKSLADYLLEDTYNLSMLVESTRKRHLEYDMHHVFDEVVLFDSTTNTPSGTVNLYNDYMKVTVEEVIQSCTFYMYAIKD